MREDPPAKADCYCDGERAVMVRYQRWKGQLLRPLLGLLAGVGVRPGHITAVSTLAGLAFCPLYFLRPLAAFGLLLGHLLLDGVDGPLARFRGTASQRGSLADTLSDQIVVAATTITWMYARTIGLPGMDVIAGGTYLFLYTMVVVFAIVRNVLGIPYSLLLRPRNIVYGWFFLESIFFPGTGWAGSVDYVVWLMNLVLVVKFASGFMSIRSRL